MALDVEVLLEEVDVEDEVVELEDELLDNATLLLVMAALHWANDGVVVVSFSFWKYLIYPMYRKRKQK